MRWRELLENYYYVGVIEIVGDMCTSVLLFHFAEVVAVVEEDIMGWSIFFVLAD
jgi:hypothetical protein